MGKRKLCMEDARVIRRLYKHYSYSTYKLAEMFSVTQDVISMVVRNLYYKDPEYDPTYIPSSILERHYYSNIDRFTGYNYEDAFVDYSDIYIVGVDGSVWSKYGNHITRLAEHINERGYKKVSIHNKPFSIHKLLAICFLNNPNNLPCVLHWDDDKLNNTITNLRFGTNQDNSDDMKRNCIVRRKRISDQTRADIKRRKLDDPDILQKELAIEFGVERHSISKILKE